MPSMRDLLERRVPQYLAVYLGAGWGLIEFVSFLEERYSISPAWTDLSLLLWVLLIPSVVIYTYNHGRPGRDAWARSELIAIPLNLVLAVFVLGSAFTTRDLSATMRRVTLTDETGATTDRLVAAPQHRKRLALFWFDAPASDTAVHWLRSGAPSALALDLSQDVFIDMRTPPEFRKQLEEAGSPDGYDLPLAAKRGIAEDLHLPYFVTGRVAGTASEVSITVTLHETASGRQLEERTVSGPDVLRLVDELSVHVRQGLRIPQTREMRDLPVVELLSAVPEAVRAAMDGQRAASREAWAEAERLYARAIELDRTFALAHFSLYLVRSMLGQGQAALEPLAAAMQYEFRLPERMRFRVKIEHFIINRDMEKAYAVAVMMTELYPNDLQGHVLRSTLEQYRDEKDAAIASMRRIVELDPQQHEVLLEIGRLYEAKGAFDEAVEAYQAYAGRFPQAAGAQVRLAHAYGLAGRLDEAAAALDRALIREPMNTEALAEQAALLRHRGDLDRSLRVLQQAQSVARAAQDRARVLSALQAHYSFAGRFGDAIDAGRARLAVVAEFQPPVIVRSQEMRLLGLYVRAGRRAEADALLARVRREMSGEIGEFWRLGQVAMAVEARDTAEILDGMAGLRRIIDDFGFRFLESEVVRAQAVLQEERGAWADALRLWQQARELEPAQLTTNRDIGRAYRMLGRHDDALRALEEHLRAVPFAPETNLEAARVRIARGDLAGAQAHLGRAAAVWAEADASYASAAELRALQQQARR